MEIDVIAEQDVLSTDNIPTAEVLSKYRLAGHFCSIAIKTVVAKCLAGVHCTELSQLGDDAILSQVRLEKDKADLRLLQFINRMSEEFQSLHR
jgi:hypothetical protein